MQKETPGTPQGRALPSKEEIDRRKKEVKNTLCCPYCGDRLKKWAVPQSVENTWPNEFMYVCLNDECPYFLQGWSVMESLGNKCSYRLMYDPLTDSCQPLPVPNSRVLKDCIIDEE
jgi:hypothetical protein